MTASNVIDHLDNMGWTRSWAATDLYLDCPGTVKQVDQRILGIGSLVRYHIRLWDSLDTQNNAVVLGAAHHEKVSLKGGHKVLSFERAEQEIATIFSWPAGSWNVQPSSHDLNNAMARTGPQAKAWNDGNATVIRP